MKRVAGAMLVFFVLGALISGAIWLTEDLPRAVRANVVENEANTELAAELDNAMELVPQTSSYNDYRMRGLRSCLKVYATSQTDTEIIVGQSGKRILIVSIFATADEAQTLTLEENNTELVPAFPLAATAGLNLPGIYVLCSDGEGVDLTTSTNADTGLCVIYMYLGHSA